MSLTVENAESAILTATARHRRWLTNFFKAWSQPQRDAVMVRWWDTLAPQAKQQAREANPDGFAEIERRMSGLREGERE